MTRFSWLHLTDLHLGMKGSDHLWPNVREAFFRDLDELHGKCGPWDAVFFTGDFVQKGARKEYERLDEVLGELWGHLKMLGSEPLLYAVPGNHDLERPKLDSFPAQALANWQGSPFFHESFWSQPAHECRRLLDDQVFAEYRRWLDRCPLLGETTDSPDLLPGDFSATFEKDGLRVGIVGLNTTFLQIQGGDYEKKLAWDVRQLHQACDGDGPAWLESHDVAILLTHQPPSWLDEESAKRQYPEIAPAGRFAVHLCGHLHEHEAHTQTFGGGDPIRTWQGSSLFGLEHYGEGEKQDRRHGYAAGVIEVGVKKATIRQWPREGHRTANGWHFAPDNQRFPRLNQDGGMRAERLELRRPTKKKPLGPSPAKISLKERQRRALLDEYARQMLAHWDIVDLAGLPEDDRNLAIRNFLLRQLYVPLRLIVESAAEEELEKKILDQVEQRREYRFLAAAGRSGLNERPAERPEPAPVGERLGKSGRLVVLGDPGAGKTTLLRWLATAYLMRRQNADDLAELPDAETLPDRPWLPIIVRCRDLNDTSPATCSLDDMLQQTLHTSQMPDERSAELIPPLRDLLERGEALLLIDGLDEISDPTTRAAFCRQLEAIAASVEAPIVVTSRIVGYREMRLRLGRGFEHATLAELSEEDRNGFIRRWCEVTEPVDRRETAAKELVDSIKNSDRIARLAGNPMLLTTLALVRRKVGRLPSKRAKLYEYAVDVLLHWRSDVDLPLDPDEALSQLEYVAYAMCDRGIQRLRRDEFVELLEGVRRDYPNIRPIKNHTPEEFLQLLEARTGLVVEAGHERHAGQMRPVYEFRHLTFQEYLAGLALVQGKFPGHQPGVSLAERVAPLAGRVVPVDPGPERVDHVAFDQSEGESEVTESWREALRLCVACCDDDDVDPVLRAILRPREREKEQETGRARAILAALSLADEPNVSPAVAEEILATLSQNVSKIDGLGPATTGVDLATVELARSGWYELLKQALVREFLQRGYETRPSVGGLAAMLCTLILPKTQEARSRWLKGQAEQLIDGGPPAVEAALGVMEAAWERWAILVTGLLEGLLGMLGTDAPATNAAAWALRWLASNKKGAPLWVPNLSESSVCATALLHRDLDPEAAYSLLSILGLHSPGLGIDPALLWMNHSYPRVRGAAIELLAQTGDPRALEPLARALEDPEKQLRRDAALALGKSGDSRALDPLTRAMEDPEPSVVMAVARALGKFRDGKSRQALGKALKLSSQLARSEALAALVRTERDKIDQKILSLDLDAQHPWMDPLEPIRLPRIQVAASELELPPDEVRQRYESLADEYGLILEWRSAPSEEQDASSTEPDPAAN